MAVKILRNQSQNGTTKVTISTWVKRGSLSASQTICTSFYSTGYYGVLRFASSDQLEFIDYRGSNIMILKTNAVFRDTGAWYHVVATFDGTVSSPQAKIYVNGVLQTLANNTNYSQNQSTSWNTDYSFTIGAFNNGEYFNGSLSDFYYIQGYSYDASKFGATDSATGIWKPILNPTINYTSNGTNSCHLKFENAGNLDLDSGGNTLSFSTSGTPTQTQDCPANNFSTLNPADKWGSSTVALTTVLSSGNTQFNTGSNGVKAVIRSSIGVSSGKWYCEIKTVEKSRLWLGVVNSQFFTSSTNNFWTTNLESGFFWYGNGSAVYTSNDVSSSAYGGYDNNNIVMMALDMDNKAWYLGKNGSWLNSGNPESGSSKTGSVTGLSNFGTNPLTNYGEVFFMAGDSSTAGSANTQWNFGNGHFGTTAVSSAGTNASSNGIFEYNVPAGYTALSTKGLNL